MSFYLVVTFIYCIFDLNKTKQIMRIHITDYFGNDIIKLAFCLKDSEVSKHQERIDLVNNIAIDYGWSVADVETDEQGEYIQVQQIHVLDYEVGGEQERIDLLMLVANLTGDFV